MASGMRVEWEIGDRVPMGNTNKHGAFEPRLGKGKGPVFTQKIMKVFLPK